MEDCKPVSTPTDTNQKLSKEMSPSKTEEMDEMKKIPYQEALGSVLYACQGTRPDIAQAISSLSRFNQNPGKAHWTALKRVMRYLKGSVNMTLEFSRDGN